MLNPTDQQAVLAANITRALVGKSPKAIAEALEVTEQAVSGWKRTGKIATQYLLPLAQLIEWPLEALLSPEGLGAQSIREAPSAVTTISPRYAQLLVDLDDLPPPRQSKILDQVHQLAEEAREAADHLASRRKVTSAAARVDVHKRAQLTMTYGDGNERQGALLLKTVSDPFTADPCEREANWYRRIGKSQKGGS